MMKFYNKQDLFENLNSSCGIQIRRKANRITFTDSLCKKLEFKGLKQFDFGYNPEKDTIGIKEGTLISIVFKNQINGFFSVKLVADIMGNSKDNTFFYEYEKSVDGVWIFKRKK